MKHLKMALMAIITIVCLTTVNAQTKKDSTTKNQHILAYKCPMKCEGDKTYDKAGKCPMCNMNLKEVANTMADTYECPMKCNNEKIYDKAGKCPKCNMNLKKLKIAKA